ncbi:MAG TPA: prepilin-type N-terminal cleavage/methylation domain-containing protein [Candidatus Eremiobacteraceae bacterium]|nr:prepilin-type N-terminal cleavage/methylation domain-containing protein [Candidatus Eremiobacteraceae bacterium]
MSRLGHRYRSRGMTLMEMLVVVSMLAIAAALVLLTPFRAYQRERAAGDAASTVAQDLALLERVAQNGGANDGATLQIDSTAPLSYDCYYGRPNAIDSNSTLGPVIVHRSFDDVDLTGGPIDATTPLLFASNGSVQYVSAGTWADQHQTIELVLTPASDEARAAKVDLNLFTGGISLP